METVREGKAELSLSPDVFYNPEMELCRDITTLAVGVLSRNSSGLRVLDGMCATGVRGIRYALECPNVCEVAFVDINERAIELARLNAEKNGVKNARFERADLCRFLCENRGWSLIELDPFGTPVPFLHDALRASRGGTILSVTATDGAVLCGAQPKACVRNYQAKPLNNEYCHETAARILFGKIAREASELDLGISPVFALSKRHYIKVVVALLYGAEKAAASMREIGFITHCRRCLSREWRKGVAVALPASCPRCGANYELAGPLWLGEIQNGEVIAAMATENKKRGYRLVERIARILNGMASEVGMPPAFYDLHAISSRLHTRSRSPGEVIARLREAGFRAERAHFCENGVKTDAPIEEVERAVK